MSSHAIVEYYRLFDDGYLVGQIMITRSILGDIFLLKNWIMPLSVVVAVVHPYLKRRMANSIHIIPIAHSPLLCIQHFSSGTKSL